MSKKKNTNVFQVISDIFTRTNTAPVLIGGFAVNYYKVTRQTADIDFLTTREDFGKIEGLLQQEGFKKDYEHRVFVRLLGEKPSLLDADFMFVDKETLDAIRKEGNEVSIAGEKFIVPSLNHLIALKLHAIKHNPQHREFHDLPDIIALIKANGIDARNTEFKSLCLKYGTENLYNEIVRRI